MAYPYSPNDMLECQLCLTERRVRYFPTNDDDEPITKECQFCRLKREAAEACDPSLPRADGPNFGPRPATPPGPPGLFYRDRRGKAKAAPPGSIPFELFEQGRTRAARRAFLRELLVQIEPTTIPPEFRGTPNARPCLEWRGARFPDNLYGRVELTSSTGFMVYRVGAHRARLALRDRCLPADTLNCCHICNKHSCIEVTHLAWGTDYDNYMDDCQMNARTLMSRLDAVHVSPDIWQAVHAAASFMGENIPLIARLTMLRPSVIEDILRLN
jgi:hypothetical protein